MKMYTSVFIILLLLIVIPDIFFYLRLKNRNARPLFIILHLAVAVFFIGLFIYLKVGLESLRNFRVVAVIMWIYFFFLLIYIPKLIHLIFYFLNFIYKKIFKSDSVHLTIIRVVLSAFVVVTMLIGAYITPRNFDIERVQVPIPNLPAAFEGYKIVQLSDIHLGGWNKKFTKLKPVIRLVNEQNPDIVVFTGDMVNDFANEADGWRPYFMKLKSKSGKYAILGNHDYGDYADWKSVKERMENRFRIRRAIRGFGFRLLLNENVYLIRGTDSVLLVGVENWGKTKEWRYCNLKKALSGSRPETPKILLSHDPTQWDAEVVGQKDIVLTLSGHTHAAQLGIKIGHRLFSPASLVFKEWAGLYKENNQYLYVNRGIGFIGLPMHIGVRPEITVIELKRQ
jgi:predicted MPP superfamily phosphohydrolase